MTRLLHLILIWSFASVAVAHAQTSTGASGEGDAAPHTVASTGTAAPGEPAAAPAAQGSDVTEKHPSIYDRIWKFAELYKSSSNPVVQKVLFTGRYQHEYAALDSERGDLGEWNVRRMRLGPKITLFHHYTLHAEIEVNPQEHDPFYQRFTDFYVQWSRRKPLVITVGKHGVPFTMDGSTSSKELLAIDRSNVSNNIWFPQEYIPGASVSGEARNWQYRAGLFSAGEMNREFGEFSGGVFTLESLGYDFGPRLGVKEAVLTGNYLYQQPNRLNTFTRQLEHIGSLHFKFEAKQWGLRSEVSGGAGYLGQPDLRALMLMPFYNVTRKVQLVGRYTLIDSNGANGVRLATYESRLVPGRGDHYDEIYGGLNYYFYGHKLKLQTGVQHADMDDVANDGGAYSGVSWTTGLRIGW